MSLLPHGLGVENASGLWLHVVLPPSRPALKPTQPQPPRTAGVLIHSDNIFLIAAEVSCSLKEDGGGGVGVEGKGMGQERQKGRSTVAHGLGGRKYRGLVDTVGFGGEKGACML